jgi:hypothetical protein
MLVAGLAVATILIVTCGSEPNATPAAPALIQDDPVVTPTPSVLSELVALRVALELKDGLIYAEMVGEPSRVWGAVMT